ncbi:MAG: hypothetical protein Kow00108_24780 [Calditrichia bacterium]
MKRFATIIMMIFLVALSYAQLPFSKGIVGGVNLTNYGGGDVDDIDVSSKAGVAGGIFMEFKLLNISVAPEVLYVKAGAEYEGDYSGVPVTYSDRLSYIQIPVMGRFYLPFLPLLKPYVTAGPYFNYLLSAKTEFKVNGQTEELDLDNVSKKQDSGVKIGVGLKLTRIAVSARYSMGLSKIRKDADVKNKAAELMLSIYF